ncbi:MAG: fatty acid desaturase [Dongiaceae bacterium]
MAGLTLGGLIILPALLLPRDPLWGWLLAPIALLTNLFWALNHEAIHGEFHQNQRCNLLAGRLMAILLTTSFHVLRFGHLMHHRFNRNPVDRPDAYDPAVTSHAKARVSFLGNLVFGLYVSELAAPIVCLLPRSLIMRAIDRIYRGDDPALTAIRRAAHRQFLDPGKLRTIRTDVILAWALLALSAAAFGRHWPMLAAFVVSRGVLISVFDNVYHFGTPIDQPDYVCNLWLPAPLRLLILNMNLHRVHHDRPALPWWTLSAQFKAINDRHDASLFSAAMAQFTGPVPVTALSRGGFCASEPRPRARADDRSG